MHDFEGVARRGLAGLFAELDTCFGELERVLQRASMIASGVSWSLGSWLSAYCGGCFDGPCNAAGGEGYYPGRGWILVAVSHRKA